MIAIPSRAQVHWRARSMQLPPPSTQHGWTPISSGSALRTRKSQARPRPSPRIHGKGKSLFTPAAFSPVKFSRRFAERVQASPLLIL